MISHVIYYITRIKGEVIKPGLDSGLESGLDELRCLNNLFARKIACTCLTIYCLVESKS